MTQSLKNYVNESNRFHGVNNTLNNVKSYNRAKDVLEPYVKAALCDDGFTVQTSSDIEDYRHHSDLKIIAYNGEKYNQSYNIDVKGNSETNKHSLVFSFTKFDNNGKEFMIDEKGYFAFVDENEFEIYIIGQKKFMELTSNHKLYTGKKNKNSKYIWVDKKFIRNNANRIIKPNNAINRMLN
jgi:hypothetical protein